MRYKIAFIILVAIVAASVFYFVSSHTVTIKTNRKTYKLLVEIADDNQERATGLMEKTSFSDDKAMLFVYGKEGYPSFWMKNMKFPIDIIFIGSDFKIRQIESGVQPCPANALECTYITPSFPVQYVLEVNSGYTKGRQIEVGDVVTLNL
jgi:uncharacterized protein